jgi:hypothetical protein
MLPKVLLRKAGGSLHEISDFTIHILEALFGREENLQRNPVKRMSQLIKILHCK